MDPLSPETRWQLIVLHIFMSGELFHTPLKMKINCSSVFMWRAGSKFTFSPFPDSFAYLLIFHVFLSVGHWTLGFLFTLADVVL